MISSRTKKQLVVFVIITLLGVSYVGARYARLDKLFYDSSFNVNAQFAQAGGIFVSAEVDYRGVRIGQVSDMHLTDSGVDVVMAIDNGWKNKIPSNTLAIVADRSAVGEQYVDLEPQVKGGPFLKDGSTIPTNDTRTPVSTTTLLTNLNGLVDSVPLGALQTSVNSLGQAFAGTGPALGKIIDGTSAFVQTATQNFSTTTALIKDAQTVLTTQADESGAIRSFSNDLALFTDTLAGHDASLRKVIDSGSATALELRTFLDENQVNLGQLINNVLITGRIGLANIKGLRQILVLYPYMVAGGYTVLADRNPDGTTNARFGLILVQSPMVCINGYHYATQFRSPLDLKPANLDTTAQCNTAPKTSDARGAKQAPRAPATDYRAPVATYAHGKLSWSDQSSGTGSLNTGKDGLAWLMFASAMQ